MHVRRRPRAVLLVAGLTTLGSLAAAPPGEPVATDACGTPDASVPDPDRVPTPAGESVPALDVCALHVDPTFDPQTGVLLEVAFTVTLAGDVAGRPDGTTYVVGWTGPQGERTCYHVLVWEDRIDQFGGPTARVGGSCATGRLFPDAYTFLDGALPLEAVTLDDETVTFTVALDRADPVLRAALATGTTLERPAALTYLTARTWGWASATPLWDTTTTTRDVALTP
ncbi:MAG: hypothetical protein ACLGIR_13525 [Actinomycetes bacterium]